MPVGRNKVSTTDIEWLGQKGPGYPVVLSCRARLARNIEGLPFPSIAGEEDLERARGIILEAVSRRVAEDRDWDVRFAEELSRDDLTLLVEEYIVSASFGERAQGRAVALNWPDACSVTVNEEDSVRIHSIMPGAQFNKVWQETDKIDSRIEGDVSYCFDERLGYLTSCPCNVGTGLRVSAVMHLPALVITGEIARTIAALDHAGMYVRGLYGEGSGVAGNLFQISNRRTLGLTEEDIVSHVELMVTRVVDNERTARKMMLRDSPVEFSDRVYRALGVAERARRMFLYEALELLSMIKVGVEMDLLNVEEFSILEAGVAVSPCHVRRVLDGDVEEEDVDRERAAQLRRVLGL